MNEERHRRPRFDLAAIAGRVMVERGFEPEFPAAAIRQLAEISGSSRSPDGAVRDLRDLLWASIDNDDSRDLDQLSVAEERPDGGVRVLIAIADVDALVSKGSPIDVHASRNTTSIYTGVRVFPMLPEKLSTDLTSLGENEDRESVVFEYTVDSGGSVDRTEVYRALVRNRAKLAYRSVSAWLEGSAPMPAALARVPGVDEQIKLQERAAERLRKLRHDRGALDLETLETRPVLEQGEVVALERHEPTRAGRLIEDFMIAANGVSARFLEQGGFPTVRRVVRTPKRWERIVELAGSFEVSLPAVPDSKALEGFLSTRKTADPERFADLSLSIVKLLGPGEYVVHRPGEKPVGHFGLAVRDYSHSTAPNRRFPDLVTQRLLKAALAGDPVPYGQGELSELAAHCTERENAAEKVERQVRKSAAAALLSSRIGATFSGVVSGASEKGTWVRVSDPPVEGKLLHDRPGLDVGDQVRVKLGGVDVERGFIDFSLLDGVPLIRKS